MRFVLYSEKTVAQCLTAMNARLLVKETSTRPGLDGWVEKSGSFSISMTAPVVGKFTRRTALTARAERESGVTVIQGNVPSGVTRQGMAVIFAALALVVLAMVGSGNVVFGLILLPFAAYLYIPLHGDYLNSAVLIEEVEKTLKAKAKPPKKLAESKAAKTPAARATSKAAPGKTSSTSRTGTAKKPAPAKRPAAAEKPVTAGTAKPMLLPPEDEFPTTDEASAVRDEAETA